MEAGRAVLLVLDGVGAGALPDAARWGDEGADTLGNISRAADLSLPFLGSLGLGNLRAMRGVPPADRPLASWGRLAEVSAGKDSTTGHWEMMGLVSREPFPTYPGGFPDDILAEFSRATGRGVLGNRPASGTGIIAELGGVQALTGDWIVYTSADSVFQIAAHEDVIPPAELYEACRTARRILAPPHAVARVIARPFTGPPGAYVRTAGRRDFSLPPPGRTLLDALSEAGIPRTGVGKLDDLFAHRGISTVHAASDAEGLGILAEMAGSVPSGLVFANLVDFDTRWGHRNDVAGFAGGLLEVDRALPRILAAIRPGELFILTADHGNDPTTPGTDHTREYAPLLAFSPGRPGRPLGDRGSFADIAATLAAYFGIPETFPGRSFLEEAAG